jgi:hypothetical protein
MEVLIKLMQIPELQSFVLVGGTNLSLRFGHRLSIDIDLFTKELFSPDAMYPALKQHFDHVDLSGKNDSMLFIYINDIKIDLVTLPYEYIKPIEHINTIRMASTEDIIAMKLNAISTR